MFDKDLLPKYSTRQVPRSHRQGPIGVGTSYFRRFFITYRVNEPVMYETDNIEKDFRYPNRMKWKVNYRNYYRRGDFILYGQMDQKTMMKNYKTFSSQDSKNFLHTIIDSEFLGPSVMMDYALIIWDIIPVLNRPGNGLIKLKPIIFFGKTAVILKDEPCQTYSTIQLSENLPLNESSQAMLGMLPFLYATMEIVQIVITGIAKTAVSKSVSVYVVRKASVKAVTKLAEKEARKIIIRKLEKKVVEAMLVATISFVTTFLSKIDIKQEEMMRKMAEKTENVDYHVFESALKSAIQAFVSTFVLECLGSGIAKVAEQMGVTSKLKLYFAKKLLSYPKAFVDMLIVAYKKADDDRKRKRLGDKPPKNLLGKYISEEIKGSLLNSMKGSLKQLVGS